MIQLGDVRPTVTGVRRFLLFQSLPQLISWIGWFAFVVAACEAVVYLLDGRPATLGMLLGPFAGALPSVWLARRASFRVRGTLRAQAWSVVDGHLSARMYRSAAPQGGVHVYRPKLPRLLRWEEQDIRISMDSDGMLVTGPYVALRGIHRLLATTFAG